MHTLSVEGTPPAIAVARGVRDRGVIRTRTGDACRNGGPRRRIDEDTLFDAASLTKIMCALPVTLRPHGAGLIGPDGAVTTWLPDLATPFGGRMTVRHLPTHTAGLIPHREHRCAFRGYEALLNAVLREDPSAPPGTLCACSDLGYILLGEILRRVAHADLPDLVDEHVRGPLGPRAASFTSVERQRRRDRGEGRCRRPSPSVAVRGHVHDENALALGGAAGHAGLLIDPRDAAAGAAAWSEPALLPPSEAAGAHAAALQPMPDPSSRRGPGRVLSGDSVWDHIGPSRPATTISHTGFTGFTGVSIAAGPVPGRRAVALSNAVPAGRARPRPRGARLAPHRAIARVPGAGDHRPPDPSASASAATARRTG